MKALGRDSNTRLQWAWVKWTSELEARIQRRVLFALAPGKDANKFSACALEFVKTYTNAELNARYGRRQLSMRDRRALLERLSASLNTARRQMEKLSGDEIVRRSLERSWGIVAKKLFLSPQYLDVVSQGSLFSMPKPLIAALSDVALDASKTLRGVPGGRSHGRRNMIVGELAEIYEMCFGVEPPSAEFKKIVEAFLEECGLLTGEIKDVVAAGLRHRDKNRAIGFRPIHRVEMTFRGE